MFLFSAFRLPALVLICGTALMGAAVQAEVSKTPAAKPATAAAAGGPALSDEQREQFRDLMRDVMENMKDSRELNEQLADLAQSPSYSDKQARAIIQKQQKQMEENLVKSARSLNDFYKNLSPDQRKQVEALHKEMKERRKQEMKERMKERRHGDDR